jgi:prolyl oligopeptidase
MKAGIAVLGALSLLCLPLLAVALTKTTNSAKGAGPVDPYLWLEDITGKKALDWVAIEDARSKKALAEGDGFKQMTDGFLTILDSKEKIPYVEKIGDYYYNFWRDHDHPRGLWRRASLSEYRKDQPAWETVLDVDALGEAEKESWVW